MKQTSDSLEQTQKIAEGFVSSLLPKKDLATIVGLSKSIGFLETITSPTFVIEKIYELSGQKFSHLIHIDAYRIEKSDELLRLGWNDIISDKNNLILIEWPEKAVDIMPEHIKANLSHISESSRGIEIIL
jgi:tRNA threonylcarbamoyladenosine biosynthesis protein TsaE